MKAPAARFEVLAVAGGLMIAMLVMMWLQQPGAGCILSFELPRRLALSRDVDREHLASDLASVDRIAGRYMRSTSTPAPDARFLACKATLVQEIATRHGVDETQVRAAGPAITTQVPSAKAATER